ncbi:Gaa1-like protein [Pelagophyceae sp. CCMP2097]|nr:Gaa1-like protein [Pelagophyceae sp. CCMP2097]
MLPAYPGLERGGVLRGAILIKNAANLPAGTARARTHGANGLLPNLDFAHLVNTALSGFHTIDACHGETCADDFATAATPPLQRYRRNLRGLALWVWSLGAQGASGAHAHFLSRGIDAATVDVGAHASAFSQRRVDAPVLASRLEHVLRSLNNVEHDLHHSYFMYLLASPHVFVSIDEMAGAITLMLLPLGLDAFSVLSQIVAEFGYLKMVESAAIEFVGRLAAPLGCGVIVYGLAVRGLLADDASVWLLVFASLAVVHFDARRRRSCWWLSRVGIELFAAYSAIHLILAHTTLALMAASAAAPILAPLRPFRFSSRLAFAARLALWFATSPFPLLVYAPFRNALLAGWVDYGDLRLWCPATPAAFAMAGKRKRGVIKEAKEAQRNRRVDANGKPVGKKRSKKEQKAAEGEGALEGYMLTSGDMVLVDKEKSTVFSAVRNELGGLERVGRWDAATSEVKLRDGTKLPLVAPKPASSAPLPTKAPPRDEPEPEAGPPRDAARLSAAERRKRKKDSAPAPEIDAGPVALPLSVAAKKKLKKAAKQLASKPAPVAPAALPMSVAATKKLKKQNAQKAARPAAVAAAP